MKIVPYISLCIVAVLSACSSSKTNKETSTALRDPLKVEEQVESLLSQLTLEEKVSLCHANSKFAIAGVERLGIKEMWMSDGPHGVREEISRDSWKPAGWTNDFATYLPPLTGVAASWNPENATKHGMVLGSEARERKKDVILGPGVNMARNPIYGRNFEYMGEDPYLAAQLVVNEIKAIQSNDVAACVKHYALNTQELNRHGVNAIPDERTLREMYLPAFEAAIKKGKVWTVMGAYNEYYGTNCNQSHHLVMDILKGEWGFKGLLMTDWDCDINTYDAAMNGLDIEMGTRAPSYDEYFLANPFLEQLKSGKIPVSVLDDKVRRILRTQISIGMMDENRLPGERNTNRNRNYAKEIIEQGIVLLKNDDKLLPLNTKGVKRVLVMGPNAEKEHGHGGGSSQVKSEFEISPLEGLKAKFGEDVEIVSLKAAPPAELGLVAILPDYIITKQAGAGTPAWKRLSFKDAAFKEKLAFGWLNESKIVFDDGEIHNEKAICELEPIKTGEHLFKVSSDGKYSLKINYKEVDLKPSATNANILEGKVVLEAGKKYNVLFEYSGKKGFTVGMDAPGSPYSTKEEYLAEAKKADMIFYIGGLDHSLDREAGDRPDMVLPYNQDYTIKELLKVNPNTIVLMVAGSPVEMPWYNKAKAVVWGWYGGMFAGEAFADVLFGKINPSGKMPFTISEKLEDNPHVVLDDYNAEESKYKEGVFMGYRWFEQQKIKPLVPFGYGLSYTTYEYSDLKLAKGKDGAVEAVSFRIKNTGSMAGDEIAQLYLGDVEASVPRPAKELKGFKRVSLAPGESKVVTLDLTKRDLSFWDVDTNDWKAEKGTFKVMIGASVADIKLQDTFVY
ncbi:glycosyl hydrolase [Wenyingzhuangia fucanilytica]|uniref:Glycosyl hydrolase n=1 Tax=Wenyingzhuangia fucanilytica TaxID=1790137 RepID=A0A1B1Y420_9FLAO|nr:glycoside hydrolase family 3 C-terminal domain-containing protein [Wenyingzhuangia fucanilytica]ANW95497.1 glycosyl hydrolase [Wenyingzhuangia fucanilytica]